MKDLIAKLSTIPTVQLNSPASLEQIKAVEAKLGVQLPDDLREFYLLCDGAALGVNLDIPSLQEAFDYFSEFESPFLSSLLVVVSYESDTFCIFHSGPLRGYVAHILHDGDSHVRWRSFPALLEQIALNLSSDGQLDEWSMEGELDSPTRTEQDVIAGRGMVEFAKTLEPHTTDCPTAFGLAFDLLGGNQVSEVASLLGHEDMFVGQSARDRLIQIETAESKAAIANYDAEVKKSAHRCAELFRNAGYPAEVCDEHSAILGELCHRERHRPDFEEWILGVLQKRLKQ